MQNSVFFMKVRLFLKLYSETPQKCLSRKLLTLIIIIIIKDIEFLEKSNEIWEKVSNMIKKKFNSERI